MPDGSPLSGNPFGLDNSPFTLSREQWQLCAIYYPQRIEKVEGVRQTYYVYETEEGPATDIVVCYKARTSPPSYSLSPNLKLYLTNAHVTFGRIPGSKQSHS